MTPKFSHAQPQPAPEHSHLDPDESALYPEKDKKYYGGGPGTTVLVTYSGDGKVTAEHNNYTAKATLEILTPPTTPGGNPGLVVEVHSNDTDILDGEEHQFPLTSNVSLTTGYYIVKYTLSAHLRYSTIVTDPPQDKQHNFRILGLNDDDGGAGGLPGP